MKLKDLNCVDNIINVKEYISFMKDVKKYMEHPEWLGDFTEEDIKYLLNNNSKIWIYYLNDEPVCSMMLIPSTKKQLNKYNLEYDEKDIVDYGPMFVNIKYVGNRLQFQMLNELDNYSIKQGFKYSVGTIHPENIYSINNIIKDDFKYIGTKEFSRGIRNIYLKELINKNN